MNAHMLFERQGPIPYNRPDVCPDGKPPNALSTMAPNGYTYIFALAMIIGFIDAYSIGANDVANSFSTAVASKTLTMRQAVVIAIFMEFLGAFLLGKSTAETIKSGIANLNSFAQEPEMLMIGMLCSLIGSSTTVMVATKFGLPISTTHALVGGIIGMSWAVAGPSSILWGWDGFLKIVVSWFASPVFAGILAALIYLSVKYIVLQSKDPFARGLQMLPLYFFITLGIMLEFIIFKGAPNLPKPESMPTWQLMACIFGGLGAAALCSVYAALFYVPWIKRVVNDNEDVKWYHIPVIYCIGKQPQAKTAATPWGRERLAKEEAKQAAAALAETGGKEKITLSVDPAADSKDDIEAATPARPRSVNAVIRTTEPEVTLSGFANPEVDQLEAMMYASEGIEVPKDVQVRPIVNWKTWGNKIKDMAMWGVSQEIANHEFEKYSYLHDVAIEYDSKAEELYSFLQVFTCSLASFAHGSNDVANAIGPLSTIYFLWVHGGYCTRLSKSMPVDLWLLAYGGIAICVGLATWGYNVMRTLGNHLTYHSPTRGFSMELGAALSVLTASFIGIPVSTTQCITGATAAVGLCNGTTKGLNWKLLGWCFLSWMLTVPIAAVISGCMTGFVINAPRWNYQLLPGAIPCS